MKVLVVDDDHFMRLLLRSWLEASGHEVVEAEDGKDAIRKFIASTFDTVILDVEMPGISGFQVAERLRTLEERWVPIVFASAMDNEKYFKLGIEAGGDFYFVKPLEQVRFDAFIVGLERMCKMRNELEHVNQELLAFRAKTRDGIVTINSESQIISINNTGLEMFGYSRDELEGKNVELLMDDLTARKHQTYVDGVVSQENGDTVREVLGRRKNGESFPLHFSVTRIKRDGEILATAIIHDVSERREYEAKLSYMAKYDTLTGLPNRSYFVDRLGVSLEQTKRNGKRNALLFLNIDDFKVINDSFGPSVGDKVLVIVAERLQSCVRASDSIAHLAADEFAIVLNDVERKDLIHTVLDKIADVFAKPFFVADKKLMMSASIGISVSNAASDVDTMVKQADIALHNVKKTNKGTFQFFDPKINAQNISRMELVNELQTALAAREFVPFYQPQLNTLTGELTGAEALLRWRRKSTGKLVSPLDFIPLLEEMGLIIPVTDWLLEESVRQWKQWMDNGVVSATSTIAVNLSVKSFEVDGLVDTIKRICHDQRFSPKNLVVEITESVMAVNIERVRSMLQELREFGVKIALDDFGTGYSSLSYLSELPIDKLKIDKSFIDKLDQSVKDQRILLAIINMAQAMGMLLVGEGVDSSAKLKFLQDNNCDIYQGFLYSPPIPANEFSEKICLDQEVASV